MESSIVLFSFVMLFISFVPAHPCGYKNPDIASKIITDPNITSLFNTDFGNLSKSTPAAVFYPSKPSDIATLIRCSYLSQKPFTISQRGVGHSTEGQTFVPDGVLVYMPSLGQAGSRINVTTGPIPYVDAGGEQLWIDILNETLRYGLMPHIFADYLYLTVGGTLSNAGISGQVFKYGPQISNVYELDVITGTGELVTCSRHMNPDLFYAALGGLGQFGVITRARIPLGPAQKTARWIRLFYTDVKQFMMDQEKLISNEKYKIDFLGGQIFLNVPQVNAIVSGSYNFSATDQEKITRLVTETDGPVYMIEAVIFYNDTMAASLDQVTKLIMVELNYISGFGFSFDLPPFNFLNRVHYQELKLTPLGLWLVPHPWLDLFLPRSKVLEFDSKIFKGILKGNNASGTLLLYPMYKSLWDDNMSAVTPDDEGVLYVVSILWTALTNNDAETLTDLNNQVVRDCEEYDLGCKLYLPHFPSQEGWIKQYGDKWNRFVSRKRKYDPKAILSPGQKIFTPLQLV